MNTSTIEEPVVKRSNRLKATKLNNKMVTDYWEDLFKAKENGKLVCWYEAWPLTPSCRPPTSPGAMARQPPH